MGRRSLKFQNFMSNALPIRFYICIYSKMFVLFKEKSLTNKLIWDKLESFHFYILFNNLQIKKKHKKNYLKKLFVNSNFFQILTFFNLKTFFFLIFSKKIFQ